MPYVRVDVDAYDEMVEELGEEAVGGGRPSGGFEYESAEAAIEPEKLGLVARWVYDALLGIGAVKFRVRYDGGYDEGLTRPDALVYADGRERGVEEVVKELATPEGVAALRAVAAEASGGYWPEVYGAYAKASDTKAARYAVDELAHELASRLLGNGFGTGEYQLYGAFVADLVSGEIVDDEGAAKPHEME